MPSISLPLSLSLSLLFSLFLLLNFYLFIFVSESKNSLWHFVLFVPLFSRGGGRRKKNLDHDMIPAMVQSSTICTCSTPLALPACLFPPPSHVTQIGLCGQLSILPQALSSSFLRLLEPIRKKRNSIEEKEKKSYRLV
ncbi:hypothetical protein B9Z19DRAFT_556205 [Tuber borchii]|uniref:Uncharacterized protein n=1 Tax=Tuber borchii TaxID=42251 RepID=A0A2T6ZCN5_TUBBO|nr:hypothetical protein B9Z19DRAFT_556205 [Tuber borchii]